MSAAHVLNSGRGGAEASRLAQGPHDADDEMQDAVVGVGEHVVADQALQRGVPRQRPGVVQHGRRRLGHRPGRHARRQPRDRPEEQRQEALLVPCTQQRRRAR